MSNFDDYHLRTHGADAAVDPVERHAFEAADVQPLCLRGNHDAPRPAPRTRFLGEEVLTGKYGLGRVTEIGPPDRTKQTREPEWIGVTPFSAGYQMKFAPNNVLDAPPTRGRLLAAADAIEKDDEARHHVECLPFHALSPEGKLTKIRHHLSKSSGVPVPAPWVQWLVEQL